MEAALWINAVPMPQPDRVFATAQSPEGWRETVAQMAIMLPVV
jgi:hypothetical protein